MRLMMPLSTRPGAELDEGVDALLAEELDGSRPLDGAVDLVDELVANRRYVVNGGGGAVRHDGNLQLGEGGGGDGVHHALGGGAHEGAVEGAAHAEGDDLLRAAGLGVVEGADDGLAGAAHDDLAGGVDGADLGAGLAADILALAHVEADDGGHRAGAGLAGGGHQLAAGAEEADGIVEREGARGHEGGVLAERVAGDEGGAFEQVGVQVGGDAQEGEAGDGDRGLRVLGLLQLVLGALEADAGEGDAEDLVGAVEELLRRGETRRRGPSPCRRPGRPVRGRRRRGVPRAPSRRRQEGGGRTWELPFQIRIGHPQDFPTPIESRTPDTSGGRAAAPGSRCRSRRGARAGDGARDACAGGSWGTCAWEGEASLRSLTVVWRSRPCCIMVVSGAGTRVSDCSLSAGPGLPNEGRWPRAHRRTRPCFGRFRSLGRSPRSRRCRAAAWEQPLHNTAAHLP